MFDNVVLDVICKKIDDWPTFENFAQVSPKCLYITKLNLQSIQTMQCIYRFQRGKYVGTRCSNFIQNRGYCKACLKKAVVKKVLQKKNDIFL